MLTALLRSTAPAQVPDLHKAYIFYCDGLGFTQDPGTWSKQRGGFKVLWFNLGRHQVLQQHAAWISMCVEGERDCLAPVESSREVSKVL